MEQEPKRVRNAVGHAAMSPEEFTRQWRERMHFNCDVMRAADLPRLEALLAPGAAAGAATAGPHEEALDSVLRIFQPSVPGGDPEPAAADQKQYIRDLDEILPLVFGLFHSLQEKHRRVDKALPTMVLAVHAAALDLVNIRMKWGDRKLQRALFDGSTAITAAVDSETDIEPAQAPLLVRKLLEQLAGMHLLLCGPSVDSRTTEEQLAQAPLFHFVVRATLNQADLDFFAEHMYAVALPKRFSMSDDAKSHNVSSIAWRAIVAAGEEAMQRRDSGQPVDDPEERAKWTSHDEEEVYDQGDTAREWAFGGRWSEETETRSDKHYCGVRMGVIMRHAARIAAADAVASGRAVDGRNLGRRGDSHQLARFEAESRAADTEGEGVDAAADVLLLLSRRHGIEAPLPDGVRAEVATYLPPSPDRAIRACVATMSDGDACIPCMLDEDSRGWCVDGRVGFGYTPSGWKGRTFGGALALFPPRVAEGEGSLASLTKNVDLEAEFYCSPDVMYPHGPSLHVWIGCERRIKGYNLGMLDGSQVVDSGLLHYCLDSSIETPELGEVPSRNANARMDQPRRQVFQIGHKNLCELRNGGMVKLWDLSAVAPHDGVERRIACGEDREEDHGYPAEEVYDDSENCWGEGAVEASVGVGHTKAFTCDLSVPSCIGFLGPAGAVSPTASSPATGLDAMMAFCHFTTSGVSDRGHGAGSVQLVDSELRVVGALLGHTAYDIHVATRPRWENTQLMCSSEGTSCKVWDLRTLRPTMTIICNGCGAATPLDLGAKRNGSATFLATSLGGGRGTRIWDLRMGKPLYRIPLSGRSQARKVGCVWLGETHALLFDNGRTWSYGAAEDASFWMRDAESFKRWEKWTWGKLQQKSANDRGGGGDCSIA